MQLSTGVGRAEGANVRQAASRARPARRSTRRIVPSSGYAPNAGGRLYHRRGRSPQAPTSRAARAAAGARAEAPPAQAAIQRQARAGSTTRMARQGDRTRRSTSPATVPRAPPGRSHRSCDRQHAPDAAAGDSIARSRSPAFLRGVRDAGLEASRSSRSRVTSRSTQDWPFRAIGTAPRTPGRQ
jgi:hypothetical protein